MALSETLTAQLHRSAALLPPPLGVPRRVETSEGPVMMTRTEAGLKLEKVEVPGTAFLPYLGEFGCFIADYVRTIHAHPAKRKLVFCRSGEECLFPSASEFAYDWKHPLPDKARVGSMARHGAQLYQFLSASLPDWEIVTPRAGVDWGAVAKVKFCPVAPEHFPAVDVVLAPRLRGFAKSRNWNHWAAVAAQCRALGLTVGVVGVKATSAPVKASQFAWHHPDGATAGTVDLLSRCRLYVGSDSGVSHLAALMDTPSVIVNQGLVTYNRLAELRASNRAFVDILDAKGWRDPELALQSIRGALFGQQETARILSVGGSKRVPLGDCAARSIRRIMPSIAVELWSDTKRSEFPTRLVPRCRDRESRFHKISLLKNPPTEWAAVIDDDTVTVRRFPGIRATLEATGCDIAMVRELFSPTVAGVEKHARSGRWSKLSEWDYMQAAHPGISAAPHYNSGVIFFRRCPAVEELADVWLEEWQRFRDVDQLALVRAIARTGIPIGTLPRELNRCSGAKSIQPTIAHFTLHKWKSAEWKREMGLPVPFVEKPCCGGKKPSLRQMAASAARALGGVLADVATGETVRVPGEERAARLVACNACEHLIKRRCELCGCFVSLKSRLRRRRCPAGKWPDPALSAGSGESAANGASNGGTLL